MKSQPEVADGFIAGSQEAFSSGIEGVVQEWKLYVQPWNIDISKIQTPVTLWYGDKDKMAPLQRGQYLEATLPNATLHSLTNEGHFSLIHNHQRDILLDLLLPEEIF
jgi:pimeloyl-ACP methyl ester carboxylesterase